MTTHEEDDRTVRAVIAAAQKGNMTEAMRLVDEWGVANGRPPLGLPMSEADEQKMLRFIENMVNTGAPP